MRDSEVPPPRFLIQSKRVNTMHNTQEKELFVSEFEVEELEDRLEFREWTLKSEATVSCTSGEPCSGEVTAGAGVTF